MRVNFYAIAKGLSSITLMLMMLMPMVAPVIAETVMYNTKTGKYHNVNCRYAKRCTVNCVTMDKEQAIKMGGVPCRVCGG